MIFSILAFTTLFISICIRERKKSLTVQSLNCIFKGFYDLTLNAYTGAVLDLVNFIRSSLFINKEHFSKKLYLFLLILFEGIIIISCIYTWEGIISLLPTVGSFVRTYCLWQSNMKYVRISGIISGTLFSLYYIYYHGWLMAFGYVLLIIISLYNVCKVDLVKHPGKKKEAK